MPVSGLNIAVTAIVPEGIGTVGAGSGRFADCDGPRDGLRPILAGLLI